MHKGVFFGLGLILLSVSLFPQDTEFEIDRFSFFMSVKPMENGSTIDTGFGYQYRDNLAGEIIARRFTEVRDEQFDSEGIEDSLNVAEETGYAVFLIPVELLVIKNDTLKLKTGLGVYYGYNNETEKGYFNMPILEDLGKERVNSFYADSSTHVLGPIAKIGFSYRFDHFRITGNIDVVPVFYLNAHQSMSFVPLMSPHKKDHTQNTWGSPYIFADINFVFLKYFSASLLYDHAFFRYGVIDFDYDGTGFNWINPDREVINQSIRTELSLLLPVYRSLNMRIGYGYEFERITIDSLSPITRNKHYLILSTEIPD
jgi:hypothetical protein